MSDLAAHDESFWARRPRHARQVAADNGPRSAQQPARPDTASVHALRKPPRRYQHRPDPAADSEEQFIRLMYEQHAQALLTFVLRLTAGDRQRAEDVVQETLLRAWRNAHKLHTDSGASLRPWLVAVARRIVIDEFRSRRSRPTETYPEDLDKVAGADRGDDINQVLHRLTVGDALRTLSHAHREILIETYFAGRTAREAARHLDLPLGTVKSRVHYALCALRAALTERGVTQ